MTRSGKNQTNQAIGMTGEKLARRFLLSKRYIIREKNHSTSFGEIDIIAKDGPFTVLVEVKTRTTDWFGSPLNSITPNKKRQLIKNAMCYITKCNLFDTPCRIDVIGIVLDSDKSIKILEHIKNAVYLSEEY
jgi:putative endonuclease